jgi:hypothetical protein
MLENLLEYYRKSNGATQKKILSCIFAEKLVLEKGPPSLKLRRIKEKLQSLSSRIPYNSSLELVRFWEEYMRVFPLASVFPNVVLS